jgi:hypothetical protein
VNGGEGVGVCGLPPNREYGIRDVIAGKSSVLCTALGLGKVKLMGLPRMTELGVDLYIDFWAR